MSPNIEDDPRTVIFGAVPKVPVMFCTVTPAALPSIIRLTSTTPSTFSSLSLILLRAPVKVLFEVFS
ncbi:hypothetical protein D3C85_1760570 [compost metagenome]